MNRAFGSLFGKKKSSRRDSDLLSPGGTSYSFSSANYHASNSSAYTTSSKQQASYDPPPYSEASTDASMTSASISAQGPSTQSADPDDNKYSFLETFDTIFLVDDSGSMRGSRWIDAREAISAIAPICTKYDGDGIDIYFLNHLNTRHPSKGYTNVTDPRDVERIFNSITPSGTTLVGKRLGSILSPYLKRVERMEAAEKDDYGNLKDPSLAVRPINIISITDGQFTDEVESVVVNAATRLDEAKAEPSQVGIQFVQIGNDSRARQYLERLDDALDKEVRGRKIRDIVDTVPWKGSSHETFTAEYLLKVVLGSVVKIYDRQTM